MCVTLHAYPTIRNLDEASGVGGDLNGLLVDSGTTALVLPPSVLGVSTDPQSVRGALYAG